MLDKEIEIVHALAQEALEYEAMLCAVSDICGELDWQGFPSIYLRTRRC